jgi:predicted enzyme related to lactoylglutathione lyase
MKIRGTDFIMFHVSDLATAVRFYRDALGLPLEICSEEHRWAEFDCGNITLALRAGETVVESGTGARLALAVDDIDTAYAELTARHAWILQPPQDHGLCRAFAVEDPDGNVILLHRRADGTFGRNIAAP